MLGKLITFEGCEGCGKTTQVRLLKEYLDSTNQKYFSAREPGGTDISEAIRSVILSPENKMAGECEALLYAASRAQLLIEKVIPELEKGNLVILDRFIDSSLAYQAYARGLGFDFVKSANKFTFDNCMPDLTVFLDVPPDNAFNRKGGADKNDRLELEGLQFHQKVYDGYKQIIEKFPDRFMIIKAQGTKYETNKEIIDKLRQKGYIK